MRVTHDTLRCGKSCHKCDYLKLGLCGGCSSLKRALCLVYECIVEKVKIIGITLKCSTCLLASACVKSGRFSPPEVDMYCKLIMLESRNRRI
ncbi:MAG: hypothetical protein FGF51_02175 [Candidatus Brockarchaeota archaeon]|nr:hypothetical protein [Candidatus Brockarchaeota archaeon]